MVGMLTAHEGPLPALLMMTKQLRVRFMMVGSRDMQLDMIRAVEAIGIHPVIDRTFPWSSLRMPLAIRSQGHTLERL
jgi:NADPH:quinone reductase-like Zn-dependent oxidoreductase